MKKVKSISSNIILKIAILLFAVLCVVIVVRNQLKDNSNKQENAEVVNAINEKEASNTEKQEKLDKEADLDYIIELAKEFGYYSRDSVLFISKSN